MKCEYPYKKMPSIKGSWANIYLEGGYVAEIINASHQSIL